MHIVVSNIFVIWGAWQVPYKMQQRLSLRGNLCSPPGLVCSVHLCFLFFVAGLISYLSLFVLVCIVVSNTLTIWATWRVPYEMQELLSLRGSLSSPPVLVRFVLLIIFVLFVVISAPVAKDHVSFCHQLSSVVRSSSVVSFSHYIKFLNKVDSIIVFSSETTEEIYTNICWNGPWIHIVSGNPYCQPKWLPRSQ